MVEAYVPVIKRQVVRARGDGRMTQSITKDVQGWSRNQLIVALRKDTVDTVAQQIRLENPPEAAVVDNTRGKPILQAVRRTAVNFGSAVRAAALNVLKAELQRAIEQSTIRRSGDLANMNNWEWVYVRDGRRQPLPIMGTSGITMRPGDFIVLRPRVPYASIVNLRVANGSRALTLRKTRQRAERPTKANQRLGFLAFAARRAKRHSLFRGFNVRVSFTHRHAIEGEVNRRQGTGTLVITPSSGRGRW
ncbi:hypothetical protein VAR608DRAFT_4870 [Variovorax sp. HW608]|uniref:hypothetical protein n=1 Tax=Variovorax sp. HW608 TaxID=1034889 RepID=UPI0008200FEC|nr:hypothetical protein [Variovorax sp. HW608]SCK49005.1 hypothetical protein VAR608DRAFT_4870 [Variovorax sp. HW608]